MGACLPLFRLVNDFLDEVENGSKTAVVQLFEHLVHDHLAALEHTADAHSGHAHHHVAGMQAPKGFQEKEVQTFFGHVHDQVEEFVDGFLVGLAPFAQFADGIEGAGSQLIGDRRHNVALLFQHDSSCCCMLLKEIAKYYVQTAPQFRDRNG